MSKKQQGSEVGGGELEAGNNDQQWETDYLGKGGCEKMGKNLKITMKAWQRERILKRIPKKIEFWKIPWRQGSI